MSDPIPGQVPEEEFSRDEQSERLIRFMDKLHANEIFSSEESKREYIQNLTFDEFKNLLTSANSMLRDIPISQRTMDGETVYLQNQGMAMDDEYIPPTFEDKGELLEEMFSNLQTMNSGGRSMVDMGLLVGASINAIHPFNDGNGRTGRLLYTLLTRDYSGSEEEKTYLKQVLGEDGRGSVDINPGYIRHALNLSLSKKVGLNPSDPLSTVGFWGEVRTGITKKELDEILSAKTEITEENKLFIEQVVHSDESHDFNHGFLAVYQYLSEKGLVEEYKKVFYKDGKPLWSRIIANPIIRDLNDNASVEEIRNNYRNIKKTYVKELINSIVHPDQYITTKYDGGETTLRDLLKERGVDHKAG